MRSSRALRACAVVGLGLVAILAAVGLYLRADKRQVFYDVAGTLASARVLEEWSTDSDRVRLVELINDSGEAVSTAWIRRPLALAEDYRVFMVYAGAETGRRILDLLPGGPHRVLVAPQYPYAKPSSLRGRLRWPADLRRAAFRSVAGGILAVDYLTRDESLESERMMIVGASLGSSFAVIHAALDRRVPRVVVVHGGGDFPLILRHLGERRGRPWQGRARAALATVLVDTFDPVHWAGEIAPRELIVIGARGDRTFPAASTLALYDSAGNPKRLAWTGGSHVSSRPTAALEEVLAALER